MSIDDALTPPMKKVPIKRQVRGLKKKTISLVEIKDQDTAVNMRIGGASFQQIANTMGVSLNTARRLVERAHKRLGIEPAAQLVELELTRLDQMQMVCWRALMGGDTGQVNAIINIMRERRYYTKMDEFMVKTAEIVTNNNLQINIGSMPVVGGEEMSEEEYIARIKVLMNKADDDTDSVIDAEVVDDLPGDDMFDSPAPLALPEAPPAISSDSGTEDEDNNPFKVQ